MENRGRGRARARAIAPQPSTVMSCKEVAIRSRAGKNKVDNGNEDGHKDISIAAPSLKELPVNEPSATEEKVTPLIVPSSNAAAGKEMTPRILPSSDGAGKSSAIPSENSWKRQAEEQQKFLMEQRKRIQELQDKIENLQTTTKITSALVTSFENRCRDVISGTFNLIMKDFDSTVSIISDVEGLKGSEQPTLANTPMEAPPPAPVVSSNPSASLSTAELPSEPSGVGNKPLPTAPALPDVKETLTPDDLAELKNIDNAE